MILLFTPIYNRMLRLAKHRYASYFLSIISIAESIFFPVPVDVILAPMVLCKPSRWWQLALITTTMSVIGGMIGYAIGSYFFEWVEPILHEYHYIDVFNTIKSWFLQWGIWVVLILGFSPVPYKIATIAAGSFGMAFLPFVIISIIGRGLRFFSVAFIVKLSANKIAALNTQWIERIGYVTLAILLLAMTIKWLT